MKYDFRLDDKKYDKIFVFGAGFSLEFFDYSLIDDKSIVITSNATSCKLSKIDYFIVSNWYSLRKSIMDYIDINKTKILVWNKISPDPCIFNDDFIQSDIKISRELLFKINEILLNKKPVIIDYRTNSMLLNNIQNIDEYKNNIENGIIPCGCGAFCGTFNIAFYLSEIYNIEKIYYIGFDNIMIDQYRYPLCLNKSLGYINEQVIPIPNYDYKSIQYKDIRTYPNYELQLSFILLLIGSIDKKFYNKLESFSLLDIKGLFKYSDIKEFRDWMIEKYIKKYSNTHDNDGYNLLEILPREIDEISLNLFKDKRIEYILYQRLKDLCVNQKKSIQPEVKK